MAKKLKPDDMISMVDVARIFGVSDTTVRNRLVSGYYDDVRILRTPKGKLFSIFDIFKHAHPNSSDDNIERMIFDYRIIKVRERRLRAGKKKRGVKQK